MISSFCPDICPFPKYGNKESFQDLEVLRIYINEKSSEFQP
jgi:hypothetical protein